MKYEAVRVPKTLDCVIIDRETFSLVRVFHFNAADPEGPRVKANREAARLNRLMAELARKVTT